MTRRHATRAETCDISVRQHFPVHTFPLANLRSHEIAIGWIHVGVSVFLLSIVGMLWWAIAGIGSAVRTGWIAQVVAMFGKPIAIALILIALVDLVGAIGLLRGQPWARPILIGISILELPIFPFGTLVGIYTLWTFLK